MQPGRTSRNALFPSLGQAVLLVIAALVLQWGLAFAVGVVGAAVSQDPARVSRLGSNPWFLGVLNIVAIGSAVAFSLRLTGERASRFFSVRSFDLSLLPPVLLTSLSLAVVFDQIAKVFFEIMRYIPQFPIRDMTEELITAEPVGALLLLVAIAPLTEEYLFRGMILRGLLTRHRVWFAVFVSALLFGLMHGNLLQFSLGLVTGAVFGWWYARAGSIAPCLIGHAAFNAVAWFSTMFPLHFAPLGPSTGAEIVHQPAWFTLTAVLFAALGVWWFKDRADALTELGVAGGWEEAIPEDPQVQDAPPPVEPPLPIELPPRLDAPPVLEPTASVAFAFDRPAQLELCFPGNASPSELTAEPPALALEPPLLEPPPLEPPVLPPKA